MRIDLNAKVRTKDGHDAGNIHRVLVDPKTERVTGLVVSTARLLGRDVIVSEETILSAEQDGEVITLGLTKQELDSQPTFEESEYAPAPAGWSAQAVGYSIPPTAYLWPATSGDVPIEGDARPALKKGNTVKDRDGDPVGTVEEIRVDEKTGDVQSFIVRAGAGLERLFGGGQIAEIDRANILRITEGEVRLLVDREEIVAKEHETGSR
jgi:sporulation protein YlmC with PRC-barrel domain